MKAVHDTYPVFESNQVLSNLHLNQLLDYLGEQERLTRANLIGIGIACGLTLKLDDATTTLHLAPGCGITTEGYLIVEADPVALTSYREYTLPLDIDYPLFRDKGQPGKPAYPMWELFPAGEPEVTALGSPAGFLTNKAVLLFVELKKEGLRNCSPNDCNDRGSQLVVTVRRLLIAATDLDKIIAEGAAEGGGLTTADLEARMLTRLNLPDIRLPRYDVPNSAPTTTHHVLSAFRAVFHDAKLAKNTGEALSAAYDAFKPLLQERHPADPFGGFNAKLGFLDDAYGNPSQIAFLQYYYDLFDDLLRAYDEMRWKGVELLCACVPSELLFPRHLMLGVPRPAGINTGLYRHGFQPACAGDLLRDEFLALFDRLVGMLASFTHQPVLPQPDTSTPLDKQIRITPSFLGAGPIEDKAIPYYYALNGTPPLHHLWSPARSRRLRANQTLGYRSTEYTPAAPVFVTDPLRFDLEPHNFLRIEGHLGKQYQPVVNTLLTLRIRYRLPIEVVALRTGAFDESAPLADKDSARFSDLETLFDVLREDVLTTLTEGIRAMYDVAADTALAAGTPKHFLLKQRAPQFTFDANTVGAWYEKYLAGFMARPYIEVDQDQIDLNAILMLFCAIFTGTTGLAPRFFAHAVSIYYMTKLAQTLPSSLDALAFADFENKCEDLLALTHHFRDQETDSVTDDLKQFVPQEALIDHFDKVLYGCNLEAMRALNDEFTRRMRELKQQQVLAYFLQKHPGIQHKAGVPLGGTFIVVYHEDGPQEDQNGNASDFLVTAPVTPGRRAGRPPARADAVKRAVKRLGSDSRYAGDADFQILLSALAGDGGSGAIATLNLTALASDPITDLANELPNGTVIADFFLPYRCGGEGGIQYVLPLPPLGLSVSLGCTDEKGNATATLTPEGGMQPVSYQLDGQPYKKLDGPVTLGVGDHPVAIRDSAGSESAQQQVTVPSTLRLGKETYIDDVSAKTYQVSVPVSGGVMPYASDTGAININTYLGKPVPSGEKVKVVVRDSAGCETSREYQHEVKPQCDLPCKGIAQRGGYRFWLPDEDAARPFKTFGMEVEAFRFEFKPGEMVDLREGVEEILSNTSADELNAGYDKTVRTWITKINDLIASAIGTRDWLILEYDTKTAGMPVLWIEAFECLDFDIRIDPFYQRPGSPEGSMRFAYDPSATTILINESDQVVPAFNVSHVDKCDPQRPRTDVCKKLDLQLKISAQLAREAITLDVTATGADQPVLYTWEVQDCDPSLVLGKTATVRMLARSPFTKGIRLCAYTKDGCMMLAASQINVG
nr:hypothetical protein [uncultured Duganella sp.]